MKIGVISDTHLSGVDEELRQVIEERLADTDLILHAGDIVGGQVMAYLLANDVVAVHGNMDHMDVTSYLPVKRVVKAGPYTIGLIHGYGAPRGLAEALRREFDDIDALVFGHSHVPMSKQVEGELWFNPGKFGSTYGIIHDENGHLEGEIFSMTGVMQTGV